MVEGQNERWSEIEACKIMGKNQHVIKEAFCELKKYRGMMAKFFTSVSEPLQIKQREVTKKNLWKILLIDIQSRGGPKLNVAGVKKLQGEFFQTVDLKKTVKLEGENRFNYLYSTIVGLTSIGPKIASVFMKNMVCEFSIFTELRDYLFLPVDTHIENILANKLKVFGRNEISKENPLKSKKSKLFQDKLSKIHDPRVDLDNFWYIGHLFCSKKSELVCQEICWIKRYCQQKFTA